MNAKHKALEAKKGKSQLSGHEKDVLRKKFGHNQLSGAEKDFGRKNFK